MSKKLIDYLAESETTQFGGIVIHSDHLSELVARAEKLEDELKEWMVTAEANEAEVQELKNTNAELRKARGCDEIIFEQLKYKKEKAEARVKELEDCVEENIVFLKWLDDMGFICDGWSNVNKAKEKYEKWKQAKEQEG